MALVGLLVEYFDDNPKIFLLCICLSESIDHLIVQNEVNLDFHESFGISLNIYIFFLDYIFVIGTLDVVDFALIVGI